MPELLPDQANLILTTTSPDIVLTDINYWYGEANLSGQFEQINLLGNITEQDLVGQIDNEKTLNANLGNVINLTAKAG